MQGKFGRATKSVIAFSSLQYTFCKPINLLSSICAPQYPNILTAARDRDKLVIYKAHYIGATRISL